MALSPTSSRPSGGGSQPVQSLYHGDPVTIGNFGGTLTWDALDSADDLLDRTDPAAPLIIAAGVYSLLVQYAASGALNANGFVQPTVTTGVISAPMATSTKPDFVTAFSLTFLATAGDMLVVGIQSHNGGDELDFSLTQAVLVKIT